ncbi:MAG: hypothetical protein FK734_01805 [Asgard group archaeon]|nr:hypothetical protein [Asgard group archaeon]
MMKIKKKINMLNKSGVSYTISSVIITATTVILVLIASTFAYQLLEQQRGTSEFNLATNSLLTLDDAVQDIAWSIEGARQTRFSIDYGQLTLYPDNADIGMNIRINVATTLNSYSWSGVTGYVEYSIPEQSVTFARREPYYILGDEESLINDGTSNLGRILVYHDDGWVNALLNYRVRVMETSTIDLDGIITSYVNVWVVKLKISDFSANIDNFDLSSRAHHMYTNTTAPFVLNGNQSFDIEVQIADGPVSSQTISLYGSSQYVVFNFIVSEVELIP